MIYCISDIHGCYDDFMDLLEQIKFDMSNDTIYILGDMIDRGDKPVDCINYIMNTRNVYFINGNHEQMMLDYYNKDDDLWFYNGNEETLQQLTCLHESQFDRIFSFISEAPYYKTVEVNEKQYFLSHAGLCVSVPFESQKERDLVWSRENFYEYKALENYTCIFGHTPTPYLRDSLNCAVWFDTNHYDKICIDCGCVYGGALAAIRLDDGKIFYVKSRSEQIYRQKWKIDDFSVPQGFFSQFTQEEENIKE